MLICSSDVNDGNIQDALPLSKYLKKQNVIVKIFYAFLNLILNKHWDNMNNNNEPLHTNRIAVFLSHALISET